MSKPLPIRNLGQYGINADLDPVDLPLNAITAGYNFRVKNGQIFSVPDKLTISTPAGFNAGYIMNVKTSSDLFALVAGNTAVKVYDGSSWTDISSVAGYAGLGTDDELLWSGCLLGNIPIINNFQHVPEYWSPQQTTQVLQPLKFDAGNTWAAKNYSAKVIRAHGQYLFALNLREAAVYLPDSYRWSHPADINGLPFTWDETDLSAVAGKSSIGGDSGAIVDGLSLRDAFMIYSEKAIHALTLSGDEFVWRKTPVSTDYGLAAKDAIVAHDAKHYFISNEDICATNGTEVKSIIVNRIKSVFLGRTNFSYIDRSYALHYISENEIWFCVPSDSATYASLAYIYNYSDDTWTIRDLPAGMAFCAHANKLSAATTWSTVATTWATDSTKWSQSTYSGKLPLGVINSDSALVSIDDSLATSFLPILVERTGLNITDDIQSAETINRVFIKASGSSNLYMQIGSQDYPGAAVRWKNAQNISIGATRSFQDTTTGVLHAVKLSGIPTAPISLSGFDIEFISNGER